MTEHIGDYLRDMPRPSPEVRAALDKIGRPDEMPADREVMDAWIAQIKPLIWAAKPNRMTGRVHEAREPGRIECQTFKILEG